MPGFISVGSSVHVTLLGEHQARIDVVVRRGFGGTVPESLAETIAGDVAADTDCQSDVTVDVVPLLIYAGLSG